MKTLYIDTSSNKQTVVGLEMNGEKDILEKESTAWKSQAVLPLITDLLDKHGLVLHDINAITVVPGPGSFTGLRVGVAIANTLGVWLKIPVNRQRVGDIVEPVYQ